MWQLFLSDLVASWPGATTVARFAAAFAKDRQLSCRSIGNLPSAEEDHLRHPCVMSGPAPPSAAPPVRIIASRGSPLWLLRHGSGQRYRCIGPGLLF